MDPFGVRVNTRPQATPGASSSTVAADALPGGVDLSPVAGAGKGAKPAEPPAAKHAKGLAGLSHEEELTKLLTPVLAAAGSILQPESLWGKKLLHVATGFKIAEGAELANKVGPGAAMFLAPEPIGMLPERFFQKKPTIPGTNIYLDPLHNYSRYQTRKGDRERALAGEAQFAALAQIVPGLTDDQLRYLILDGDLRKRNIAYADPRAVVALLNSELERRRVAGTLEQVRVPTFPQTDLQRRTALTIEGVQSLLHGDLYGAQAIFGSDELNRPLDGSIQPAYIRPVNAAALRNQDGAEGIRRDLVQERADP